MPGHIAGLADVDVLGPLLDQSSPEGHPALAIPEVGDDALEVLEGHDPTTVDEVVLLIALRIIDAAEVARVDGIDREEDRLAPHPIPLEKIADPRGESVELSEVAQVIVSECVPAIPLPSKARTDSGEAPLTMLTNFQYRLLVRIAPRPPDNLSGSAYDKKSEIRVLLGDSLITRL